MTVANSEIAVGTAHVAPVDPYFNGQHQVLPVLDASVAVPVATQRAGYAFISENEADFGEAVTDLSRQYLIPMTAGAQYHRGGGQDPV